MNMFDLKEDLFARAKLRIPGGVNSPVRAFHGVDGTPIFFQQGMGPYLIDSNKKKYIDYINSWGALILGHANETVMQEVTKTVANGLSFGAPTLIEVELAEKICSIMPHIQKIRMVNSGTESTMTAIRLARGYTNRNKIIKFSGCYHGHVDSLLVEAGSGGLTFAIPNSKGIPHSFTKHTLIAEYNNSASVLHLFEKFGQDIAAIIVEPVAGNMNCILPKDDFLIKLRQYCDQYGALLIFDEVMTGFRIAFGGAKECFQVTADLTTLGKIIGGGLPVGAIGGREDIMDHLAPLGPVYQAGTLSGNPVAMAGGLATLNSLTPIMYDTLSKITSSLTKGLLALAKQYSIPLQTVAIGGMFGIFFTEEDNIESLAQVKKCNLPLFKKFFHGMLEEGIYFAPSAFEAGFTSIAHSDKEIALTLEACQKVFARM